MPQGAHQAPVVAQVVPAAEEGQVMASGSEGRASGLGRRAAQRMVRRAACLCPVSEPDIQSSMPGAISLLSLP